MGCGQPKNTVSVPVPDEVDLDEQDMAALSDNPRVRTTFEVTIDWLVRGPIEEYRRRLDTDEYSLGETIREGLESYGVPYEAVEVKATSVEAL